MIEHGIVVGKVDPIEVEVCSLLFCIHQIQTEKFKGYLNTVNP